MLQRIQTVYILLSIIATGLLFVFPVWTNGATAGVSIGSIGAGTHIILMMVWLVMILLQFVPLFLYKHRKRQITFCKVGIFMNFIFIALALIFINEEKNLFSNFYIQDFRIGALLPFASVLFLFLATKNIRKDEELVRSMDRLR